MNTVQIHDEVISSSTFRQVAVDGSHNIAEQFSLGVDDLRSVSYSDFRFVKIHNDQVPTCTFSKFSVDGTHSVADQDGFGFNPVTILVHDASQFRVLGLYSILSFSANFWSKLNSLIQLSFSATVALTGQFIKRAQKLLPELVPTTSDVRGLRFRGDSNMIFNPLGIGTIQVLFSTALNFVSTLPKRSIPRTASSLSFIGALVRPHNKILTAALSFAGVIRKSTLKQVRGVLSFIGTAATVYGDFSAIFQSALSFSGTVNKRSTRTLMPATLFFSTAKFPRFLPRLLQATLLLPGFFRATFHAFTQSLTAALSFVGSIARSRGKNFSAALSFVGTFQKRSKKTIAGSLSFIGTLLTGTPKFKLFQDTLSFIGNFSTQKVRIFSAILSFSGRINRSTKHSFASTLSFVTRFVHARVIAPFTGALSFSGSVTTRQGQWLLFSAALSFSGNLVRKVGALISSVLNFIGSFSIHSGPPVVYEVALNSYLRFNSFISSGWQLLRVNISKVVNQFTEAVRGTAENQYRINEWIKEDRVTQTIGTTSQLINLSDFSAPPPCLFIKNTDASHYVEIDTSSSFISFPQKIYPGQCVVLSPQTTTLYAKANTSPVDILLSPGRPELTFKKNLNSSLRFRAEKVVPETFTPLLTSRLSFRGDLPGFISFPLYVQFDVNWHDSGTINNGSDMIHIGEADLFNGNYVAVFPQGGSFVFWSDTSPFNSVSAGTASLDTWITIGIKLEQSGGTIMLTPQVDGTEYTPFDAGLFSVTHFFFGIIFSVFSNNVELDNLTIGTGGWGSQDAFVANFDDFLIVPPFDSQTGSGISASGGTLLVNNLGGIDAYARKSIVWP